MDGTQSGPDVYEPTSSNKAESSCILRNDYKKISYTSGNILYSKHAGFEVLTAVI
jgi:hypothetical protein